MTGSSKDRPCFAQHGKRLIPLVLLLIYSIIGAFVFNVLESNHELEKHESLNQNLTEIRNRVAQRLGLIFRTYADDRIRDQWVHVELIRFQRALGLDTDQGPLKWTLLGSLYYSMTLYTTIGYGNLYPETPLGRLITVIYALIGIPLTFASLLQLGFLISSCLICIWRRLRVCCSKRRRVLKPVGGGELGQKLLRDDQTMLNLDEDRNLDILTLPTSFVLFAVVFWVALTALVLAIVEKWDYASSAYFTLMTFTTIGLGDMVPDHTRATVILCFVFALIGIALVSALLALIQQQVESLFDLLDAMVEGEYLAGQLGGDAALPMADEDREVDAEINRMLKKLPLSSRALYWASSGKRKKGLKTKWAARSRYRPRAIQTDESSLVTPSNRKKPARRDVSSDAKSHDDVESLVEMCGFDYNTKRKK